MERDEEICRLQERTQVSRKEKVVAVQIENGFGKGAIMDKRNTGEANGQSVIDDPVAVAMISAVGKRNCRNTMELNADRVEHFKQRLRERGLTPDQAVIMLINVDDVHGGPLADALMPGHDWQKIRDKGEIPFVRGLALRDGIQEALNVFDKDAAIKLQEMKMDTVAVVVIDHGVAEVFEA